MSILYIVASTLLIATVNSKSTSVPAELDYKDYYDNDEPSDQGKKEIEVDKLELPRKLPQFITKEETVTAKLGERIVLDCETENEDYDGFVWQKGAEPISLGTIVYKKELYTVMDNKSLIIKRVAPSSSGYYMCVIKTQNNDNRTLTHRVKTENAAEIVFLRTYDGKTKIYAGSTLNLTCQVKGKPMPSIKWNFHQDETSDLTSLYGIETQHDTNVLTINDVSLKNSGEYQCLADTMDSSDHLSIKIDVLEPPNSGSWHLVPTATLLLTTLFLTNQ